MPPDLRGVTLPSGLTLEVAEQGRGPVLLCLHGYTDSWGSFAPILRLLPDGLRALAPSQRGHGGSDRPEGDFGPAQLAADAIDLLDALEVEQATVLGHSMGSLVAQALALAHPDRVRRLVLVGSAARFDSSEVRALAQAVSMLADPVSPEFVREFQASTVHRPISAELLDAVVAESLRVPARVWRLALAGLLDFDTGAVLGRITMPTLLAWGDQDRIASREHQERLRRGIPRSTLRVFPGTGHAPHWEEPGTFVEMLLGFLGD